MRIPAIIAVPLFTLAGCGGEKTPAADATVTAAPPVVTITAKDYAFDAPDTVMGGVVNISLVNQGPELHHVQLVHLADGKKAADLEAAMKALKPGEPMPAWAHDIAGPNVPAPGSTSSVIQDLAPGEYAIICAIPSPDGIPHFMKGMIRALTVLAPTGAVAALPASDVNVRMVDYSWEITPTLSAGKHVLRVENAGEQSHEIFFATLNPGKTAIDLATWAEKPVGPPPGAPLGGTSAMAKGSVVFIPVDLAPGEYGIYCFIPDAKDGKPHLAHGMMRQITVQ